MEISEGKFYMFWAVMSVIFLKLGFDAIDNSELSNSVPLLAMFLFKHSLAIVTCYSIVVAYFSPSQIYRSVNIFLISFTLGVLFFVCIFGGSGACCFFPMYAVTTLYNPFLIVYDSGDFASETSYKWELVVYAGYTVSATIFACLSAFDPTNYDSLGYCVYAFSLYASCLYQFEEKRRGESLPSTDPEHDQNLTISNGTNSNIMKKSLEFAIGLLGTVVFQNFFRLNSFKQVVAFLYLAVAWLANITVLSPSRDLGVFNFLLGNAIVGCSVSEFGLRGKTWIAYAASVFLYCLRLKLQSLSFENRAGNRKVILW